MPTTPPLLVGIVDDGRLLAVTDESQVPDAVRAHRARVAERSRLRSDRLVVPARLVPAVIQEIKQLGALVPVVVVLDDHHEIDAVVRPVLADPRTSLSHLVVPGGLDAVDAAESAAADLPARVAVSVVVGADADADAMDRLGMAGLGAALDARLPADRLTVLLRASVTTGVPLTVIDGPADEATRAGAPGIVGLLRAAIDAVDSRPASQVEDAIGHTDADAAADVVAATEDMLALQARDVLAAIAPTDPDAAVIALEPLLAP